VYPAPYKKPGEVYIFKELTAQNSYLCLDSLEEIQSFVSWGHARGGVLAAHIEVSTTCMHV